MDAETSEHRRRSGHLGTGSWSDRERKASPLLCGTILLALQACSVNDSQPVLEESLSGIHQTRRKLASIPLRVQCRLSLYERPISPAIRSTHLHFRNRTIADRARSKR